MGVGSGMKHPEHKKIHFQGINLEALTRIDTLLSRWLPGGRYEGDEYTVCNPKRGDRRPGSFRINTNTGAWADFATSGARGGDLISLAAYLFNLKQGDAAKEMAKMLGVPVYER